MIKTIGLWNYHEVLNNNFMLYNTNATIGDDLLLPIVELGKYLNDRDIKTATLDMLNLEDIDVYLFLDMPDISNRYVRAALHSGKPLYLLASESPLVRPENCDVALHAPFTKVFTYNDSLVDGIKYIKINYSFNFPPMATSEMVRKEKLCTTIAGNKKPKVSGNYKELYSERIRAIQWFEKNHPDGFDLYGGGWGRPEFKLRRILNPFKLVKMFTAPTYATYKGTVERKRPVLAKYKFSICYENVQDIPGYITEKIFDCFFAGTVPVYLGANNITDYIPKDCFVDKRDFPDYGSLYEFMTTISEDDYNGYLKNICDFMQSDKTVAFSCKHFVKTICTNILGMS